MASPQKENGFTSIANEILEHLSQPGINGSEYRVVIFLLRKTYGFHKKVDRISLSQFQKGTGMRRANVVETIKSLVVKRLLLKDKNSYSFNKNWEQWVVAKRLPPVVKSILPSSQTTTKSSSQTTTYKRKKETNTKETITEASSVPWILEEKLLKMEEKTNSPLDIIASFIREKPVRVENAKQLSAVISRYIRIATTLSGAYTNKQIFDAAERIRQDNKRRERNNDEIDWGLNTIYKYLTK